MHAIAPRAWLGFQSARPWGTRSAAFYDQPNELFCFNPRVRGGRDLTTDESRKAAQQFQSARPWGTRSTTAEVLMEAEVTIGKSRMLAWYRVSLSWPKCMVVERSVGIKSWGDREPSGDLVRVWGSRVG